MTARKVEYLSLDEIPNADRNPKEHDLRAIGDSIERFGFVDVITLDERTGKLVSGHGRKEALQQRRDAGQPAPDGVRVKAGVWFVPVVRGWASRNDDEAAAFLLAANRVSERGGWNAADLADLLGSMAATDVDLVGTGFDAADLAELLALSADTEPEKRTPPGEFPDVDPDAMDVDFRCPQCSYEWSGNPTP